MYSLLLGNDAHLRSHQMLLENQTKKKKMLWSDVPSHNVSNVTGGCCYEWTGTQWAKNKLMLLPYNSILPSLPGNSISQKTHELEGNLP